MSRTPMRTLAIFVFLAVVPVFAGEYVILANGGRLHADRHQAEGDKIRLYTTDGYIEIEASQVRGFEADDAVPATPVAAPKTDPAPVAPPPAPAVQPQPSPAQLADAAADKYGLPRGLVRSVISAESAGRKQAVSPKGAIGLMQLMPATAKDLGVNPHDPAQNVDAGVRYLRDLLILYDGRLWHALAAYNAGPGAVEKHNGNIPPYRETLQYIQRVDRQYHNDQQ